MTWRCCLPPEQSVVPEPSLPRVPREKVLLERNHESVLRADLFERQTDSLSGVFVMAGHTVGKVQRNSNVRSLKGSWHISCGLIGSTVWSTRLTARRENLPVGGPPHRSPINRHRGRRTYNVAPGPVGSIRRGARGCGTRLWLGASLLLAVGLGAGAGGW